MKIYLISYSNGYLFSIIAKSLRAAKIQATKMITYEQEVNGIKITIYEDSLDNVVCYKSYNKYTEKASNIGKWINIGE